MRKWNAFLAKGIIREIGDTLGLTPRAFARETPTEVVAVDDVKKQVHIAIQMMAEGSHGACVSTLCNLKKQLEKKSGEGDGK